MIIICGSWRRKKVADKACGWIESISLPGTRYGGGKDWKAFLQNYNIDNNNSINNKYNNYNNVLFWANGIG